MVLERIYRWVRIRCLRIALGPAYNYMVRTLQSDPRLPRAYLADIVVRKDSVEKRFEADWLKDLARLVKDEPTKGPGQ